MTPPNARPFDPNNRPLKGEWVLIDPNATGGSTVVLNAVTDHSTTYGIDVVRPQATAPGRSKGIPLWAIVVGVLAGAVLVGFLVLRLATNRPSQPGPNPAPANELAEATVEEEQNSSVSSGQPVLKLVEKSASGSMYTWEFQPQLNKPGASLDPADPVQEEVTGGTKLTERFENGRVRIRVRPTAAGSLRIDDVNYASDVKNRYRLKRITIRWPAPFVAREPEPTRRNNRRSTGSNGRTSETMTTPRTTTGGNPAPAPAPSNTNPRPRGDNGSTTGRGRGDDH